MKKCLQFKLKSLSSESSRSGCFLPHNIGAVYSAMGEYSKALSSFEKALEIRRKSLPSNHPDLAASYNSIGNVYSKMGEYSKALSSFEKALEISRKALPSNHPDLGCLLQQHLVTYISTRVNIWQLGRFMNVPWSLDNVHLPTQSSPISTNIQEKPSTE